MSNELSLKTVEFNLKQCPGAAAWVREQWKERYKELTGKEWQD